MPNNKDWKEWEKAMKQWLKDLLIWQKANPTRDWATALFGVESSGDDSGGSNPPPPPPPKPPGS